MGVSLLAVRMLLKFVLQGLSWTCLAVYAWWSVSFCMATWTWEYRGSTPPMWEKWRLDNTIRYRMTASTDKTLWGWDVMAVLMWWFPALLAALSAHIASSLPCSQSIINSTTRKPTKKTTLAKRVLTWQLPPRSFWVYWCDGLNVAELLGVIVWIVVHCVAFSDLLQYYGKVFNAWDLIGWRTSVPRSVLWLELISYSFAWLSFIDLAMLFLPISHDGFLSKLTGLPYSALIRYHRWLGHSAMWMIALHGIFFYFYWIADPEINFWEAFFDWGKEYYINVFAGTLAFAFGCALWITSLNWVRRKYFEVFYKTHIVGFIGFVFFAMLHYGWMWTVFVPGLALYAADYVVRLTQSQSVTTASAVRCTPDNKVAILELPAEKGFSKCPVQDLFMLLPSISRWQWHPFTIMGRRDSSDGNQVITVGLKAYGSWTTAAIRHLMDSDNPVPVRVTGTLDGKGLHELREYEHLVMVAGGIAATPIISLLSEIAEARSNNNPLVAHIRTIHLVWAARSADEFTILPAEILLAASRGDSSWLSVSLFCTSTNTSGAAPLAKEMLKAAEAKVIGNGDGITVKDADSSSSTSAPQHGHQQFPAFVNNDGFTTFPTASAFFWNKARRVQPKTRGLMFTLATIICAFVGAFMGLILTQAMVNEWNNKHYTKDTYYKWGMTIAIAITIQTIGLPMMLVVLPVNLFSYMHSRGSNLAPMDTKSGASGHINTVSLMADRRSVGVVEAGLSVPISSGRPHLNTVLQEACAASGGSTVGVFCAGPVPMIQATAKLVWEMNDKKVPGQSHMDFHKFAFEL